MMLNVDVCALKIRTFTISQISKQGGCGSCQNAGPALMWRNYRIVIRRSYRCVQTRQTSIIQSGWTRRRYHAATATSYRRRSIVSIIFNRPQRSPSTPVQVYSSADNQPVGHAPRRLSISHGSRGSWLATVNQFIWSMVICHGSRVTHYRLPICTCV